MTTRRRNISWSEKVDLLAVQLAAERGMSVSDLIERLIKDESEMATIPPTSVSPGMKRCFEQWLKERDQKKETKTKPPTGKSKKDEGN